MYHFVRRGEGLIAMSVTQWSLILAASYAVGSISPSYILGRLLKKIDIREHGDGNAGTVNTYRLLGTIPAAATALFDLSKGLLMMAAARALGAPPLLVHLAGCAAIIGHVFPFYLRFRGGQGVAVATAILLAYLTLFIVRGWMPWTALVPLAVVTVSFALIARKGEVVAVVVLPILALLILVFSNQPTYEAFLLSVIAYIVLISVLNIRRDRVFELKTKKAREEINWRLFLRPLAVILIIDAVGPGRKASILLIGGVALFFLLLDLVRLISKNVNLFLFQKIKALYKSREAKKFSSITIFLLAAFLALLVFDRTIAVPAIGYLIFGDFFSKFFGILYGRTRVFQKTLEGSLAHFNACLVAGVVLHHVLPLPLPVAMGGALAATIAECLPLGVDDNFSVVFISAAAMTLCGLIGL